MYWITRRRYGAVLSPVRVLYARKLRLAFLGQHIATTLESGLSLDDELTLLAATLVARNNDCAFCQDLNLARSIQERMGAERFAALGEASTSPLFTARERAALAFCAEAAREHTVCDATFEAAREHFGETELVELAWIAAAETYFNIQSGVFRLGADGLAARATHPARLGVPAEGPRRGDPNEEAPPSRTRRGLRTPLAKASGGTVGT